MILSVIKFSNEVIENNLELMVKSEKNIGKSLFKPNDKEICFSNGSVYICLDYLIDKRNGEIISFGNDENIKKAERLFSEIYSINTMKVQARFSSSGKYLRTKIIEPDIKKILTSKEAIENLNLSSREYNEKYSTYKIIKD